jgi:hypothetical protein
MERTKVLFDGSNMPEARAMTRKQSKEFNSLGLNPMRNEELIKKQMNTDEMNADDYMFVFNLNDQSHEWILDNIYSECDFDDADNGKLLLLTAETYKKTFAPNAEIKNS